MGFLKKLMAQGGHPEGLIGTLVGRMMNGNHQSVYRWGLTGLALQSDAAALDLGCGGGAAVQYLTGLLPDGKVHGLDHSHEMVELARQINRVHVDRGQVEIRQGSVSDLPYAADQFDLVTAFETIQFWPNLEGDLLEVRRVLKPGGRLLIANRYPDLEGKDAKWAAILQIHSAEEYRARLQGAGFSEIQMDISTKPGWIRVTAVKALA